MRALWRSARLVLAALEWPEPAPAGVTQAVWEPESGPWRLAYVDADQTGLFASLVHATSSAHASMVRASGLVPLRDMRRAVGGYMLALAPELGGLKGGANAVLIRRQLTCGIQREGSSCMPVWNTKPTIPAYTCCRSSGERLPEQRSG